MAEALLQMSLKEMGRLEVLQRVVSKKLTQVAAAAQLGPTHEKFHGKYFFKMLKK